MLSRIGDESQIEGQIVYACYLHGQEFLCLEEVMQVSLGCDTVDVASVRVYGTEVHFPFLVAHVHRSVVGEEHGVASVAGWHHTVEHVHSSFYGLEYVLWCTHTHEIARLVLGQDFVHHLYHFVHHLSGLAYGKSTDSISVGSLVCHIFGRLFSQLGEGAALHDGEEALLISVQRFGLVEALETAVEPTLCHLETLLGILEVALSRRTLVERHHDVGTNNSLSVHHVLGCEDVLASVDVRAELAPLLTQLSDACKREHLESATVCQDGSVPSVEAMQSACGLDDLESWS